ncbi:hypothetical protein EJB05_29721, partial [Eragrostis curvula]
MGPTAALLLLAVAAASAASPADSTQDAAAIVSISPCLPHVAAGALRTAPTDACCVALLRAVSPSGGGCHLLRDPLLLGFPVDAARLRALLSACAAGNSFSAATLFADACRARSRHGTDITSTEPSVPARRRAVAIGVSCDPDDLADHIMERCTPAKPTPACCEPLLAAVWAQPNSSCFCSTLLTQRMMTQVVITAEKAVQLCLLCGASRDMDTCGIYQGAPPSPALSPAPTPSAGPPPSQIAPPSSPSNMPSSRPKASAKKRHGNSVH